MVECCFLLNIAHDAEANLLGAGNRRQDGDRSDPRRPVKPLHALLPELLRKQPQKHLPLEEIVRAAWPHLAGRQVAARSQVFRLYRETLIVHVPDHTWQKQLRRLEGQLLARVNQLLGRRLVTGMDFRVDANLAAADSLTQPPPRKGPAREEAPRRDAELENSARAIADPELRALFLRASQKMIREG